MGWLKTQGKFELHIDGRTLNVAQLIECLKTALTAARATGLVVKGNQLGFQFSSSIWHNRLAMTWSRLKPITAGELTIVQNAHGFASVGFAYGLGFPGYFILLLPVCLAALGVFLPADGGQILFPLSIALFIALGVRLAVTKYYFIDIIKDAETLYLEAAPKSNTKK